MGKKKKLARFAENETFPNMFQLSFEELDSAGFPLKGQWKDRFFKNQNPLVLELGCGKGEYSVGLARAFPGKNFIGLDIKGARMWKGCKISQEEKMPNVAFVRTRIELICHFFDKEEVDEIWITFPDPQPRQSREKKRLTSPVFLDRYRQLGSRNCLIHLKTDSDLLFGYTMQVIENQQLEIHQKINNLYNDPMDGPVKEIKTHYEKIWLEQGLTIKYLCFSLFSNHA
ncbi:MAG TPA: tRNA (guanosine(46)-N7)-methyltransferase TrmB [Bacteroidales bacterium]|nr:tRNA (guanosine(46)-N7)-methyltransferase TrmB [Bacteroidales bacterium]